jgi:hypothetical protein
MGTTVAYARQSSFPGGREFQLDHYQATQLEADLRQAMAVVPEQVSLAASRRVVPQLAARRDLFQYPFSFYGPGLRPDSQRQDFYILDLTDSPTRRALEPAEADSVLEKRPRYNVERLGPSVLLLSRTSPRPQIERGESFAGTLRLAGLDWPRSAPALSPTADRASDSIRLFWAVLQRPAFDANRVLRLVGPTGETAIEIRGQPLDSYLPVRDWERGQVVSERLDLPPSGPALSGGYRILLSWQLADGSFVPVDGSGVSELELARLDLR